MGRLRLSSPGGTASKQEGALKSYSFFLAFLLLMSLLAACGNGSATAQPVSSPTKTVSVSTPLPTKEVITSPIVGTYTITITQKDVAANPDLASDLGTHTWVLKDDGTYFWKLHTPANSNLGSFNIDGTYQIAQDEVSMKDALCANYLNAPGAGTYTWQRKGNTLILQVKSDDCVDRKLVLTMHPLVKQSS